MSISNTATKKEKLKELIWFIVKNHNRKLYETKLWKLVFFCDADYYQKYEGFLTSVTYIKNKQGPTPDYRLASKALEELISNGFISKVDDGTYVALKDLELNYLDAQKKDAINSTCEKYAHLSTNEICTLAHRDPVYLGAAKYNDVLDFSLVFYRDDGDYPEAENFNDAVKPEKITFSEKAKLGLLKFLQS